MLAALVRLQRLTGARCGELVQLTPGLIQRNPELPAGAPAGAWTFEPPTHKGSARGKGREIVLGPEAQRVLAPLLIGRGQDQPVFSPAETMREHGGRPATGARAAGAWYTTHTVSQAIKRACDRAGVERWTTHRLRHTAATEIRRRVRHRGRARRSGAL